MILVEITRHELEKNIILNKYGKLDFYAYCNTPWRAIGIQSFVNNLSEKNQKLSGIVFLANQPGREAIVHPEDFNFNNNVEVQYFKNIDVLSDIFFTDHCGSSNLHQHMGYYSFLIIRHLKIPPVILQQHLDT